MRPLVQRYAARFFSDPARAEDLAQTAMMKAFSRVGDVRAPEAFHAWLLRITRNECLNELARQRHSQLSLSALEEAGTDVEAPPGGHDDPEESLLRAQLQDMVRVVVAGLPAHYRRTLEMRALEDRSYEEISDELRVPVTVARLWYCRARKRFRVAFVEAMVARRDVPDACRRMASDISELIEGTLGRGDRDRIQGHLAGCHVCRQTEEELRNTAFRTPARAVLFGLGFAGMPARTLRLAGRTVRRGFQAAGHASRGAIVAGAGSTVIAVAGAGGALAVHGGPLTGRAATLAPAAAGAFGAFGGSGANGANGVAGAAASGTRGGVAGAGAPDSGANAFGGPLSSADAIHLELQIPILGSLGVGLGLPGFTLPGGLRLPDLQLPLTLPAAPQVTAPPTGGGAQAAPSAQPPQQPQTPPSPSAPPTPAGTTPGDASSPACQVAASLGAGGTVDAGNPRECPGRSGRGGGSSGDPSGVGGLVPGGAPLPTGDR